VNSITIINILQLFCSQSQGEDSFPYIHPSAPTHFPPTPYQQTKRQDVPIKIPDKSGAGEGISQGSTRGTGRNGVRIEKGIRPTLDPFTSSLPKAQERGVKKRGLTLEGDLWYKIMLT
jgi:hypothetical protein